MNSQICRSASRAARSLLSSAKNARFLSEGRAVGAATVVHASGKVPQYASSFGKSSSGFNSKSWITGLLALPAAAFMLQDQEVLAAEVSEIVSRFERKGYKLVGIKVMVPSKGFAQKHYHDLKERPFFNGLCNFLSSGPVVAMVWEGEGVIRYGRKLIGATDPQKSEPGTIRGDLAVVVGRNIIHGSDGPETAKDEISLWFKPEELVSYTSNAEKWIYGQN
ncbi:PREDICTED: nucleoside diphosphate kinase IV, chloroplastic/mitochondrial isoform X2 [Camelina sativa]|uniref:Nucleoside diphosphate kinase n=1 Tax=Camelina sativa TaxID=90675 RepID=A0ABM0TZZ4_CAMSA|nr:PREDICTED: nucleoside diphosphate kinase IV, chloroplastic/mitochondrial isoform X2 [Camelina sativa]